MCNIMPRIIKLIMSYTCMQHLKIEHQDNGSKLASGINSSVYRRFIVFGKNHYVGGFYYGSTEDKVVSYVRGSGSKLKDYCLINFIESVINMNLDDDISMIRSLQSICNMFKVGVGRGCMRQDIQCSYYTSISYIQTDTNRFQYCPDVLYYSIVT